MLRLAEHGLTRIAPAVPGARDNPAPLAFQLGSPRPATAAAREARPAYGGPVGRVLSAGTPMALDQVVAACQALVGRPRSATTPQT